jgi:uncharacterized protein
MILLPLQTHFENGFMEKVIIQKLDDKEIEERQIRKWPVWEKEVSRFDHVYDGDEECLILDGEIIIEAEGVTYTILPGDFVIFKEGLKCVWDIKKTVRKHYNFPDL